MTTYKLNGARFENLKELKEALWPLYQDKMSKEEFDKYIDENVEVKDE